ACPLACRFWEDILTRRRCCGWRRRWKVLELFSEIPIPQSGRAKHHVLIGNFAIKVRLRECTTRGWWLGPAASAGPLRGPPSFWAPAIAAYTSRTTAAPPMHLKVTRDSRTLSQNGQRIYLPAHLEYARLRRTRGLGGSLDAPVFLRQTQMLLNRGQASFDI